MKHVYSILIVDIVGPCAYDIPRQVINVLCIG